MHSPTISTLLILCNALQPLTHYVAADREGRLPEPTSYQSPRFRWWWPGGWIDPVEVSAELAAIIDAGFGGAEISDVQDTIKDKNLDPKIYGWAQARWNAGVLSAYQEAQR